MELFERIKCPKIQMDFISFRKIRSLLEIRRLIKFIKKHEIDIVQTYFQDPALLGLVAAKLSRVKHIIACFRDMGFWRQAENDLKMKLCYKFCSAYIANSSAVKNLYVNIYSLSDDKFTVIYNGIDIESFTSIPKKGKQEDKDIIVGIVANLNRQVKRVDVFLKAAVYVLQRIEGIKFIVAGDGELCGDLINLSKELGISEDVEFIGVVENIPQLLSTIDIGVISSDSEGFSNAILEYMATGVPVVATDVGGNSEVIKNGVNGFLVPRGDYRSMGERVMELALKKSVYNKMRKMSEEIICKHYLLRHCIERYETYYERQIFESFSI